MSSSDRVRDRIEQIYDEIVDLRRDFHTHPEIGMEEYRTSRIVAEKLEEYGVDVDRNVANTGVVGSIRAKDPKGTIAFRADMDALPISEQNDFEYASKVDGVMHACGHDGHTASLIGVGKILSEMRDELNCDVKLIFQPDEEDQRGGGATPMVKAGVVDDVDIIVGAHIWNEVSYGKVGMAKGPFFAISDRFKITVKGKSGHAGYPQLSCDTIPVAAEIVTALQNIVSRNTDPFKPAVISIGTIKGGYRANVISDEVVMTGTLRAFDPKFRDEMIDMMERIVKGVAAAHNASAILDYGKFYPVLVNSPEVTEKVIDIVEATVKSVSVNKEQGRTMAGEDFACFLEKVPGTFMMIGGAKTDGSKVYPHHHPKFEFDERAMKVMMQIFCNTALGYF